MTNIGRKSIRLHGRMVADELRDYAVGQADIRRTGLLGRVLRRKTLWGRQPLAVYWFRSVPNFGDALSPFLVRSVSGLDPAPVSKTFSGKILAVGSILHNLRPGDIVWGSGAIERQPVSPPPGVTFLAVRGPLTRAQIRADVPEVYGDPSLLLPMFYCPSTNKRYEIGIVPHYTDQRWMDSRDPAVRVIDVRKPWQEAVLEILECRVIISSSLHGIIIAEAYGIPAARVSASDMVQGGDFKFDDYYLSTAREPRPPVPWPEGLAAAIRQLRELPGTHGQQLLDAWPKSLTVSGR